jgi:hypothetical protein
LVSKSHREDEGTEANMMLLLEPPPQYVHPYRWNEVEAKQVAKAA